MHIYKCIFVSCKNVYTYWYFPQLCAQWLHFRCVGMCEYMYNRVAVSRRCVCRGSVSGVWVCVSKYMEVVMSPAIACAVSLSLECTEKEMCVGTCVYIHMNMNMCIYVIRKCVDILMFRATCVSTFVNIYMHINICIYAIWKCLDILMFPAIDLCEYVCEYICTYKYR